MPNRHSGIILASSSQDLQHRNGVSSAICSTVLLVLGTYWAFRSSQERQP